MNLVRYELKKIMQNKMTYISAFIITILCVYGAYHDITNHNLEVGEVDRYNQLVKQHQGEFNHAIVDRMGKLVNIDYKNNFKGGSVDTSLEPELRCDVTFAQSYYAAALKAQEWESCSYENEDYPISMNGLKRYCERLRKQGQVNSFNYKDKLKQFNMRKEVGAPQYHKTYGWEYLFDVMEGQSVILISLMVLIVAATIFSKENSNNMQRLIYSTKNGHKKIVFAKIMAVSAYTIIVVTSFILINALIYLVYFNSLQDYGVKLKNLSGYYLTPYNISLIEALLYGYVVVTLSAITLGIMFSCVSCIAKSNIASMVFGLFIVIITFLGQTSGLAMNFKKFIPTISMNFKFIFRYESVDIFNHVFLYPKVMIVVLLLQCMFWSFITYRIYLGKMKGNVSV